jgi:hypothetical protein
MTEGGSHEVRMGGEGRGAWKSTFQNRSALVPCRMLSLSWLCLGLLLLVVRYSDIITCASWIGANARRTLPVMKLRERLPHT